MQCPFCKEEIQDGAIKCKHCQSMLNGSSETKPLLNQIRPLGKWLMIGIFVLSISAFFFTNFSITVPIVGKMGASMYDAVKITNQSGTSGNIAEQKPDIKDVANSMYEDSKNKGESMLPFIFMGIAVLGLALHYILTIVWGICTFVLRRTFRSLNMMWLTLAVQFPILFAIGGKIILSDLKSEMLKDGGQENPFAAMGAAVVSTFSIDPGIIMWILMAASIIALALHFIDKQMGILSTDGVAADLVGTTNPEKLVTKMQENATPNVSEAWRNKFDILKKIGADKQFIFKSMGSVEFQGLSSKDKSKIIFNAWAFLFGPLYYFGKKMWAKGAMILGIIFVYGALQNLFEIILTTSFPSWVNIGLSIVPGVICSQLANYDYFRFVTQNEKMWGGVPSFMSKPAGYIFFLLLALVFFLGIVFFSSDNNENASVSETKSSSALESTPAPTDQGETDPALSNKPDANIVIGTFNGCSTHQGITECAINISAKKTIYISDNSTSESVFSTIDMENWIGKNVRLFGSMESEGNYFIATSIELAE